MAKNQNIMYLLGVPTVSDRFVLIIFQDYVLQQTVGHIFYNMPLHRETTIPFVLLPILKIVFKVNWSFHLRNTNKLPTGINLDTTIPK